MKTALWQRMLFFIWPPYHAHFANDSLKRSEFRKDWEVSLAEIRASVPLNTTDEEIEALAKRYSDSESNRKKTLEEKATSFVTQIGVTVSLISIIPTLFGRVWRLTSFWAHVDGLAYLAGLVYLLIAAYYGIMVRKSGSFALPTGEDFLDLIKTEKPRREDAIYTVAQARWNTETLVQKLNFLSVAEGMFLRGLSLIAFAAVTSVGAKLVLLH